MNLAEYLAQNGISQADFARRAGLSTGTVSILVRGVAAKAGGKGTPVGVSLATRRKIMKASNGAITEDDFELREAVFEWAAE